MVEIIDFVLSCRILHLGGFGSLENTPTVCGDDLPSIVKNFKNDPKSRSVNNSLQQLDFFPRLLPKPGCKGRGFRLISLNIYILYRK